MKNGLIIALVLGLLLIAFSKALAEVDAEFKKWRRELV